MTAQLYSELIVTLAIPVEPACRCVLSPSARRQLATTARVGCAKKLSLVSSRARGSASAERAKQSAAAKRGIAWLCDFHGALV